MVALDTLRVLVPRGVLWGYDEGAFRWRREEGRIKGTQTEKLLLSKDVIRDTCGMSGVEIGKESFTVEVSAKILGEMYPRGITAETVDRIPEAIRAAGILDLDGPAFLESAEVLRCDAAVNLPVEDVQDSLRHLRLLGVNDRYHARPYNGTGIVFTREVKTAPERLTFYDKFGEMTRGKNKRWIEQGILDPDPFRGILRAESNFKNLRSVRRMFGIEEPRRLLDVLSSGHQPVLTVFERVLNHPEIERAAVGFAELMRIGGGYAKVRNRIGDVGIFERCDWNWGWIKVYVQGTYSGRSKPSRILADLRATFLEESRKRSFPQAVKDRIAEVHQLLRKAA